jgi:hypothetical protein
MKKIQTETDGYFVLSRSDEKIEHAIEESLEECKRTLIKGAEKDLENACYIKSWNVKENVLNFTLNSGNLVRSHVGLLRLKKE